MSRRGSKIASALSVAFAVMCFGGAGCCGIPNGLAVSQARNWVAQGMPPGTHAATASAFLKSKGFEVRVNRSINPHQLQATKHVGQCWLNITYDDLYVSSTLDDSDRVVRTTVATGVSPGI